MPFSNFTILLQIMCLIVEADSFVLVREIYKLVLIIVKNQYKNQEVSNALAALNKLIITRNISIEESETHDQRDYKSKPSVRKLDPLKKKIQAYVDYQKIYKSVNPSLMEGAANDYFQLKNIMENLFEKYSAFAPLFSRAAYGKVMQKRFSNAVVENWNKREKITLHLNNLPVSITSHLEKSLADLVATNDYVVDVEYGQAVRGKPRKLLTPEPQKKALSVALITPKSVKRRFSAEEIHELDPTNHVEQYNKRPKYWSASPTGKFSHFNGKSIQKAAHLASIAEQAIVPNITAGPPSCDLADDIVPIKDTSQLKPYLRKIETTTSGIVTDERYYTFNTFYAVHSSRCKVENILDYNSMQSITKKARYLQSTVDFLISLLVAAQTNPNRKIHFLNTHKTEILLKINKDEPNSQSLSDHDVAVIGDDESLIVCPIFFRYPKSPTQNHYTLMVIDNLKNLIYYFDTSKSSPTEEYVYKIHDPIMQLRSNKSRPSFSPIKYKTQADSNNCGPLIVDLAERFLISIKKSGEIDFKIGFVNEPWHDPSNVDEMKALRESHLALVHEIDQKSYCIECYKVGALTNCCKACRRYMHNSCCQQSLISKYGSSICSKCAKFLELY